MTTDGLERLIYHLMNEKSHHYSYTAAASRRRTAHSTPRAMARRYTTLGPNDRDAVRKRKHVQILFFFLHDTLHPCRQDFGTIHTYQAFSTTVQWKGFPRKGRCYHRIALQKDQ